MRIFARIVAPLAVAGMCLAAVAGPVDECLGGQADDERTLVLALDGVPFRSIERARDAGAFAGWPEAQPLVSTFPSVTNVGFTAIFQPFGVEAAGGYEVQHFDVERNAIVGGSPFGYKDRLYAWRDVFHVTGRSVGSKLAVYTRPRRKAWKEVDEARRRLFDSEEPLVLAHVGATDALIHLRGDKAIHRFLLELEGRLDGLKHEYESTTGRTLRIVLLSDHGNTDTKIRKARGLRRDLRRAGLRVRKRLREPGDVVAPTFGLVGYGALFLHQDDAEVAGRAIVDNPAVELAAWIAGPGRLAVVAPGGAALVRWRVRRAVTEIAYDAAEGDPLRLALAAANLRQRGLVDADGFAREEDWFRASAGGQFPDAPRRLIQALTGTYVDNRATVMFSLRPGYAWGWAAGHVSSRLAGGRLEGTHGALDRESTLGFYLSDDADLQPDSAVRAERALAGLAERAGCFARGPDASAITGM